MSARILQGLVQVGNLANPKTSRDAPLESVADVPGRMPDPEYRGGDGVREH